jgi:microcystin-dependent protein
MSDSPKYAIPMDAGIIYANLVKASQLLEFSLTAANKVLGVNATGTGYEFQTIMNTTEIQAYIEQQMGGITTVPVGAYQLWPFAIAPDNWLLANGAVLLRADFPELVSVITANMAWDNDLFGSGDGTTTFVLKELDDHFLKVQGTGDDSSRILGSLEGQKIPVHAHDFANYGVITTTHGDCSHGVHRYAYGGCGVSISHTGLSGSGTILAPKSITFNLIVRYV